MERVQNVPGYQTSGKGAKTAIKGVLSPSRVMDDKDVDKMKEGGYGITMDQAKMNASN